MIGTDGVSAVVCGALALLLVSGLPAAAADPARDVESLKGVAAFGVIAEYAPSPGTPSYLERTDAQLRNGVEARLRDAGLPVEEVRSPYLRVRIRSGGTDHGMIMYGVELDFMRHNPGAAAAEPSESWQLHSWGVADNRELEGVALSDIEEGLGRFVQDWLSVNPTASP